MRDGNPGLFDLPASGKAHGRFEPARLTQARVLRGLSKMDLAAEVGVSAAAVGQYEAGVNAPRPEVVDRLARALAVRAEFFNVGRPLAHVDTVHAHFRSLRSARVCDIASRRPSLDSSSACCSRRVEVASCSTSTFDRRRRLSPCWVRPTHATDVATTPASTISSPASSVRPVRPRNICLRWGMSAPD